MCNLKDSKTNNKPKLVVFFSLGVSLSIWENLGMLSRNQRRFNLIGERFSEIFFITYGDKKDVDFYLCDQQTILPNRKGINKFLYSLLIPFIYHSELSKADAYIVYQLSGSMPGIISKFLFKKPLIIRGGYQLSKNIRARSGIGIRWIIFRIIEILAYKASNAIIVTTQDLQSDVQKYTNSDKICIVPNGIDTKLFKPINAQRQENTLCFVGRLSEEKNLFSLLRAVENTDNVTLNIMGDGPLRASLENYAQKCKARVNFWGRIPNEKLPEYLNKSQIFVFPSFYEGHPKAPLEAMACGLPVIASNIAAHQQIIKHKVNGFLCGISPDEIKQAILTLMADKDLQAKLGKQGRQYVEKYCSFEQMVKGDLSAIFKVLSNDNSER